MEMTEKKPLLLHYYVTEACNARCIFCDIWKKPSPVQARLRNVTANLRDARAAGCRFVDFTGGEPLMNRDLPAFLAEAKRLKFMTSVTTNTLLFEKRAQELAGLIDLLHFSIDSDVPAQHNRIRGVDSFDSVMRSIDTALSLKMQPDLLFTYTEENISSFAGISELARRKGLTVILDPLFTTTGTDPLSAQTHATARSYAKARHVYLNRAHLTLRSRGGNHTNAPRCYAVQSTIVISPDNQLILPCYHNSSATLPISNNLAELLKGPTRRKFLQKEGQHRFCEGCSINCYFDPSYTCRMDRLFLQSLLSKSKYTLNKYILSNLL
ncbi:MAG: radical SAM protein [Fibrobacterota bacterium]